MIDVEFATAKAKQYAQKMVGPYEFTLEEIERDTYKGRDAWVLTLGYPKPPDPTPLPPIMEVGALFRPPQRAYKTFVIDALGGDFIAMKLRELQP